MKKELLNGTLGSLILVMLTICIAGFLPLRSLSAQDLSLASNEDELKRTWNAARVYLPAKIAGKKTRLNGKEFLESKIDLSGIPVVIHAHGCAGIDGASIEAGVFLSRAGYAVIEPDSFARKRKPISCDPTIPQGGLHRAVLKWRQEEVRFALAEIQKRQPSAIFLMGLSEGAITVATFTGAAVSGRIIEGWTCNAGWQEYKGLNSPKDEPVLSLVSDHDPWFRLPVLQGHCGEFMEGRKDANSVVFGKGSPLRESHWLSYDAAVKTLILEFLNTHSP